MHKWIYPVSVPLWASWLKDFDILKIFYDELKIEKMAKFEILIATNGLRKESLGKCLFAFHRNINNDQEL